MQNLLSLPLIVPREECMSRSRHSLLGAKKEIRSTKNLNPGKFLGIGCPLYLNIVTCGQVATSSNEKRIVSREAF